MKKFGGQRWRAGYGLAILLLLFLRPVLLAGAGEGRDGEANGPADPAAEVKAAQQRALELNAAVIGARRDLERTRADLAAALAELKQLRDERDFLRLRAANVLVNDAELDEARVLPGLIRDWRQLSRLQQELYEQLVRYRASVNAVLETLGAKEEAQARQLLSVKMDLLLRKVQDAEALLRVPAAAAAEPRRQCRVLSVNDALGVVALDCGQERGARPGMSWVVQGAGASSVRVQVIETRPSLSAAVVIVGELKQVVPGAVATQATNAPETE